jgi:RNA polymerase-binding transcription factor DksA
VDDSDLRPPVHAARKRVEARIRELAASLDEIVTASEAANLDDEHDPEGATVGFERAQVSALLDDARRRLVELEAAEERMRTGEYGICARCGQAIATARLDARPATRVCIACASARRR